MRPFKFLKPSDKQPLHDFLVYLRNFCEWNNEELANLQLRGIQYTEWGEFYKINHNWHNNYYIHVTFRFHQNNGDIYTIKLFKDFDYYTRRLSEWYIPENGIRHNNA